MNRLVRENERDRERERKKKFRLPKSARIEFLFPPFFLGERKRLALVCFST